MIRWNERANACVCWEKQDELVITFVYVCVCVWGERNEGESCSNIPEISPVVISRAIENKFVVLDDVRVWWGWYLVHLAVSSDKDDLLVVRVERHDVLLCRWFRAMVLLLPVLNKIAHFLFQCLQEALGCFGPFQFLPKLLGHFASFAIGGLFCLLFCLAARRFGLFLLTRCFLSCYMDVPQRGEVVGNSMLPVSRMNLPIAGKRGLGPWIIQQAICVSQYREREKGSPYEPFSQR